MYDRQQFYGIKKHRVDREREDVVGNNCKRIEEKKNS